MQLPAEDLEPVTKRLRRAQGQLAAVLRMIEEERDCREIVTQLSACSKALDRAGFALVSTGLRRCLAPDTEGGSGSEVDLAEREADLEAMEKLFLSLA